jgi:hypothetical protein
MPGAVLERVLRCVLLLPVFEGQRRWTAISKAFSVNRRSLTALRAHPTTKREKRSPTAARYSLAPSPIKNSVVSLT